MEFTLSLFTNVHTHYINVHYRINDLQDLLEVFTMILLKIEVFLDVALCHLLSSSQHFERL